MLITKIMKKLKNSVRGPLELWYWLANATTANTTPLKKLAKNLSATFDEKKLRFDNFFIEKEILRSIKHERIVTLYGTFQDSKNLYYVLEYLENGNFEDHLYKTGVVNSAHYVGNKEVCHANSINIRILTQ